MNLFIAVEAHEEMVMSLFDGPDLSLFLVCVEIWYHVDWPEIDEPSGSVVRLVGPGKASSGKEIKLVESSPRG